MSFIIMIYFIYIHEQYAVNYDIYDMEKADTEGGIHDYYL